MESESDELKRPLPTFVDFPANWCETDPKTLGWPCDEDSEYSRVENLDVIPDYDGLSETYLITRNRRASTVGYGGGRIRASTTTMTEAQDVSRRGSVWRKFVTKINLAGKNLKADKFALGHVLGKGHFGIVQLGTQRKNQKQVAIKMLREGPEGFRQRPEEFLREAEILGQCDHEGVIKLIGVCHSDSETPWIVTEFMAQGNLKKYLVDGNANNLPLSSLLSMAHQISTAMQYLSASPRRIIHRDLAARNVLVSGFGEDGAPAVKVADLGLARRLDMGQELYRPKRGRLIALRWAAPEVMENFIFSTKSDVWAYGMTLYELMSRGRTPFERMDKQDIMVLVIGGASTNFPMAKAHVCPESVYELLHFCWRKDPRFRPTFDAIEQKFVELSTTDNTKL